MTGWIVRFMVWLVKQANRFGSVNQTILPLKLAGITTHAGKRQRVAISIKHDTDWDKHLERSWNKKRYWYFRTGNRKLGTLQVLDLIVEWRIGRKENR